MPLRPQHRVGLAVAALAPPVDDLPRARWAGVERLRGRGPTRRGSPAAGACTVHSGFSIPADERENLREAVHSGVGLPTHHGGGA
ncbi:hypothetical protein [Actinokineospora bangkokensis]|uniref:hypothetical protein n=1 Tax=Actinokineospora bangkokensis TaxID=1193682 RepID=UPI000ABA6F9B|nr:hypothetical protein [Actinokineospora bangkokensis]